MLTNDEQLIFQNIEINEKSVENEIEKKFEYFKFLFVNKMYGEIKNQYKFYIDINYFSNHQLQIINHYYFNAIYKTYLYDLIDRFDYYFNFFNTLNFGKESTEVKKLIMIELLSEIELMIEEKEIDNSYIDFIYKINNFLENIEIDLSKEINNLIVEINSKFNKNLKLVDKIIFDSNEHIKDEEMFIKDIKLDEVVINVLGSNTSLKNNVIMAIFRDEGFNLRNINLIDYDDVKKTNIDKLLLETRVNFIMVGPTPHSAKGIGSASSIPVYLKENTLKDTVIELKNNSGTYKITKDSLGKAISKIKRIVKMSQVEVS